MALPRFAFSLVQLGSCVYAIGGREYGSGQQSVLNRCERYSLLTGSWEAVADLNQRRCSACAVSVGSTLVVAGGLSGPNKRLSTFERYNESLNAWELMAIQLVEPLESATLLRVTYLASTQLLVLGGRPPSGPDRDSVTSYDISNGFDSYRCLPLGSLGAPRCSPKTVIY